MHDNAAAVHSAPSLPSVTDTTPTDATPALGGVGAEQIAALQAWLLTAAKPGDNPARIDTLRALEDIKATCTAVQSQVLVELHDDALVAAREHAVNPAGHHDSAGRQVPVTVRSAERDATASTVQQAARALRLSPHRTRTMLGAARVWHEEMPHTLAALRAGRLSEERALLLVKETACLTLEDRARVDADLCADPATLHGVGTRRLVAMINEHANQIDPAALVKRAAKATSERCVTIRPAPDTMTYVTALLPVAQGVQVYAALKLAADSARYTGGDERSTGQIMADTLVERTTGQERAAEVPVTVNLVVSDAALLGGGHEPAVVLDATGAGHGTIPAAIARNLTAGAMDLGAAWLRTIYATTSGDLIGTTSKRRFFADGLADLLRIRDQGICRTPWCDARSAISITSDRLRTAAPPAWPTGKGSALPATRQRKHRAGARPPAPILTPAGTSSPPPHRPDTSTGRSPRRPREPLTGPRHVAHAGASRSFGRCGRQPDLIGLTLVTLKC